METQLPPPMVLYRLATAHYLSQAVYVAAKLGIADHLADGPQSHDALAKATGTHAPSLRRVLRLLAAAEVLAERDDGRFELVRIDAVSRLAFLTIFPRVYRGRHLGHPACRYERVQRVRIRFDREMALWGDGERLARVDASGLAIEVVRAALRVPVTGLDS